MKYNTVVAFNFEVEHDGDRPTRDEVDAAFRALICSKAGVDLPPGVPNNQWEFEVTDDTIENETRDPFYLPVYGHQSDEVAS